MTDYSPGEEFHAKHQWFGEASRPDCTLCDDLDIIERLDPEKGVARIVGINEYTIAELQARSHQQSKDKGFHDYQPTDLREIAALNAERVALFHSEASEMLEEQRKGHAPDHTYYSLTTKITDTTTGRLVKETIEYFEEQQYWDDGTPYLKPEGQGAEAADMIIRILDWAGANNVDMQKHLIKKLDYNATRAKMHGGKAF